MPARIRGRGPAGRCRPGSSASTTFLTAALAGLILSSSAAGSPPPPPPGADAPPVPPIPPPGLEMTAPSSSSSSTATHSVLTYLLTPVPATATAPDDLSFAPAEQATLRSCVKASIAGGAAKRGATVRDVLLLEWNVLNDPPPPVPADENGEDGQAEGGGGDGADDAGGRQVEGGGGRRAARTATARKLSLRERILGASGDPPPQLEVTLVIRGQEQETPDQDYFARAINLSAIGTSSQLLRCLREGGGAKFLDVRYFEGVQGVKVEPRTDGGVPGGGNVLSKAEEVTAAGLASSSHVEPQQQQQQQQQLPQQQQEQPGYTAAAGANAVQAMEGVAVPPEIAENLAAMQRERTEEEDGGQRGSSGGSNPPAAGGAVPAGAFAFAIPSDEADLAAPPRSEPQSAAFRTSNEGAAAATTTTTTTVNAGLPFAPPPPQQQPEQEQLQLQEQQQQQPRQYLDVGGAQDDHGIDPADPTRQAGVRTKAGYLLPPDAPPADPMYVSRTATPPAIEGVVLPASLMQQPDDEVLAVPVVGGSSARGGRITVGLGVVIALASVLFVLLSAYTTRRAVKLRRRQREVAIHKARDAYDAPARVCSKDWLRDMIARRRGEFDGNCGGVSGNGVGGTNEIMEEGGGGGGGGDVGVVGGGVGITDDEARQNGESRRWVGNNGVRQNSGQQQHNHRPNASFRGGFSPNSAVMPRGANGLSLDNGNGAGPSSIRGLMDTRADSGRQAWDSSTSSGNVGGGGGGGGGGKGAAGRMRGLMGRQASGGNKAAGGTGRRVRFGDAESESGGALL